MESSSTVDRVGCVPAVKRRRQSKEQSTSAGEETERKDSIEVSLLVLGAHQDAGYPQIGCLRPCCANMKGKETGYASCLALLVDNGCDVKSYLFDATPHMSEQLRHLASEIKSTFSPQKPSFQPDGVFLTHAHIGHYQGLTFMGREALSTKCMPVFCMPKMRRFLEENGPWSQLVTLQNIHLNTLCDPTTKRCASKDSSPSPIDCCCNGAGRSVVSLSLPVQRSGTASGIKRQAVASKPSIESPTHAHPMRAINRIDTVTDTVSVMPFLVPHRQEFSETVGFRILGPSQSAVYLPDIDSWEEWEALSNMSLLQMIEHNNFCFLDGTFFDQSSLRLCGFARDVKEVPHPFILGTVRKLFDLNVSADLRHRVIFTHSNHTNEGLRVRVLLSCVLVCALNADGTLGSEVVDTTIRLPLADSEWGTVKQFICSVGCRAAEVGMKFQL